MSKGFSEEVFWLNGHFHPLASAAISPFDRGFLYGDGLFETMRAQDGQILFLDRHLKRLQESAEFLRLELNASLNWSDVLGQVLRRNHLLTTVAAVKIIVTRGVSPELGLPAAENPTICITARKYQTFSQSQYQRGWRLYLWPWGFAPPLARHKTLNYLYFLAARQEARDHGCDESVILDPAGNVCETATGSLLIKNSRGEWFRPESPYQLPGITIQRLTELFSEQGVKVTSSSITTKDLMAAETVWVTSSLMGVMPVSEISGHSVSNPDVGEAARQRSLLFGL